MNKDIEALIQLMVKAATQEYWWKQSPSGMYLFMV